MSRYKGIYDEDGKMFLLVDTAGDSKDKVVELIGRWGKSGKIVKDVSEEDYNKITEEWNEGYIKRKR